MKLKVGLQKQVHQSLNSLYPWWNANFHSKCEQVTTPAIHNQPWWLSLYGYQQLPNLALHLPPPFNSLAGQTLLPASFFSSPSPFSHSTHLQPDGLQVSSSNDTARNILLAKPRSQTPSFSQAVWCPGEQPYVSTWSQIQQRERQWQRAYSIGNSRKKRQRQKHAHHQQQLTRAPSPGGQFPAKFRFQPIKLDLYPLAHTYTAN